ncbi:MAG: pyridoxal-phosphate dependent enzyme [Candidatus Neomarinimicrobiota bacterium]|nr:serine dehydratase [Candidatus Neomarinimicrobiota bacterium]
MIELSEIRKARSRIKPFIHQTPVLTSLSLNKMIDSELYFKCENFQKSGSFKIRGAANTVLQLNSQELEKGVVTASSGNHGAALSMVVSRLGITPIVVMPNNTPKVKVDNVKRNGGKVVWCEPNQVSREKILDDIIKQTNSILVHPYNDKRIIEGQGTVTLEFLEQCPNLETIVSPIGGGGLLSGTICSAKSLNKTIKIYGAEPKEADDTFRSIKSGTIQVNQSTNTICDGLRAQIGTIPFPIIKDNVEGILTIEEKDIIDSMKLIWETMKIIVEPSCAITLAAILKNKRLFLGKKVGLIISGGNVDLKSLPWNK